MGPAEHTQQESIEVQENGHIAVVVINRPHKLNAMTLPMWDALGTAVSALSRQENTRCIIIRGAGEKSFSPGNDISEFSSTRSNKKQAVEYGHVMHRTATALAECRHPLVAQIHGICVGGGLEIAALCDIRVCGVSSRFGAPIKNLGLVMAYPELAPIARLVRPDVVAELLFEGRILDAHEALAKGLVTRVVADELVADEALSTALRIADGAPLAARWHKKFMQRLAAEHTLSAAEYDECFDCFDTEDFQRGYTAFLAKQKPEFMGR